jgi:myxalamid-type polyketide synthase MxaE and MxaD
MNFSFAKWSQFFPELRHSSFFTDLNQEVGASQSNDNEPQITRERLSGLEGEQRQQALSLYIEKQIARVLGHPSLKLEKHQHLNRLGIDSLMSVELKNRINADLGTAISPVTFLQGVPFNQLVDLIEEALV